jgi:hypothetical protein
MAQVDINSSCVRVDFVNALASQLKLQVAQTPSSTPPDEAYRKLKEMLDAVDQAVKSGDPQKAELALFEAQSAVKESQNGAGTSSDKPKSVDAYA